MSAIIEEALRNESVQTLYDEVMAGVCKLLVVLFVPDVALFLPRLLHP